MTFELEGHSDRPSGQKIQSNNGSATEAPRDPAGTIARENFRIPRATLASASDTPGVKTDASSSFTDALFGSSTVQPVSRRLRVEHESRPPSYNIFDHRDTLFKSRDVEEIDPDFVVQLMRDNPDIPQVVIERASQDPWRAGLRIRLYRSLAEQVAQLSVQDQYKNFPQDVLIEAVYRSGDPEKILGDREYSAIRSKRHIGMKRNGLYVEDVPAIQQRHGNWCGYSSLAMVLQYSGYTDLTPEKLFRHELGEYDILLEYTDPSKGPTIETLALIAKELTPLTPRIFGTKEFEALQARSTTLSAPQDVLKAFLEKKKPSIIRMPHHFVVVTGFDPELDEYAYNDPAPGVERVMPADELEFYWGMNEYYPRDARHLMMVLTPPKGKPQATV